MCLSLPCRVVALGDDGTVVVSRAGTRSTASMLAAAADVSVGDWVLVHSGFVLDRLTEDDVCGLADLADLARDGEQP